MYFLTMINLELKLL